MHCSGNYVKIAEPPGYESKSVKRKHKHQNDGLNELFRAPRKKPAKRHQTVGDVDEFDVNKGKTITKYFPIVDSRKLTVDNHIFADASQSHFHHNDAIILKIPEDMVLEKSFRGGGRYRRKQKYGGVAQKHCGQGSDYTVMSRWFDWDVEEEEFCKDLEPLLNKRSERRKKHCVLMTSKLKATEDYTLADLCPAEDNNIVVSENTDVVTHTHPLDPLDASACESEASDFCRGAGSVKAD